MKRLVMVLVLVVVAVSLSACGGGKAPDAGAKAQAGKGSGHGPGAAVAGAKGKRPAGERSRGAPIPVATRAAFTGSIASYYKATATLEAEKEAQVLARATGVVETLLVEEGAEVAADAPLLTIANDEYRMRLQQAAARTANLRSKFDRLQAMKAEELTTEEEFEAARSDLASAEADEGLARLALSYTTVRAPFAGRVTARLVDVGQNLTLNTPLFVLADFHPLLARVYVPSREFNKLRQDQLVDLVLDSNGARLQGRITLISPVIDPNSGTIKITVEISDYPAGTRPGDFAEVQIVTERRNGVILVPRAAVVTDKGETVVFVVVTDDEQAQAERRVVTVGFTDDDNAQITAGLSLGEPVVVQGQRSLKHGTPVKVLDGEVGPERAAR